MKRNRLIYEALSLTAVAIMCTACEDYTEHNFGKREELYEPTEVQVLSFVLNEGNYADLAANADNKRLAEEANDEGKTLADLQSVGEKGYFRGRITPEDYLPAYLRTLIGTGRYYALTAGSSVTVTCLVAQDSTASAEAYVPATSVSAGNYVLFLPGVDLPLAYGEDSTDKYVLYLLGSPKAPGELTFLTPDGISAEQTPANCVFALARSGSYYTIRQGNMYLCADGAEGTFLFTDDIENDIDEPEQALWQVTRQDDGTALIRNVSTGQEICYDAAAETVGAYTGKAGTDGFAVPKLYRKGTVSITIDSTPEPQDVTFTLDADGWTSKGDYLNQSLLGWASIDMEAIYETLGWSIEFEGGIGELNYVWKADAVYGLRASAYVSGKKTPTRAWAISPRMNLKKATNPILTFKQAQKYADPNVNANLQVYVSTDYAGRGGRSEATWTDVTAEVQGEWPDGSSWDFHDGTLDLSAYAGEQNVVVAFLYISTEEYAATWEIKDIRCAEPEESPAE